MAAARLRQSLLGAGETPRSRGFDSPMLGHGDGKPGPGIRIIHSVR
jgi:hypothetical protein